jgi:plastocyanin
MRRVVLLMLAVALAAPCVAVPRIAGAGPGVGSSEPPPGGIHVEVRDDYFAPATVDLRRGGTVVFDHLGPSHHTATDATGMHLYDSGAVDETSPPTWYTFEAAGTYPFTCILHPFMGGRARVPLRAVPETGGRAKTRTLTWATGRPPDGFVYDVQIGRPGERWSWWRRGVVARSSSFRADAGRGRYRFRARLRKVAVAASGWSQPESIRVG